MSKMKVAYMGKEHDLEIVVPGVVQKGNAFLIQCARSGEWCYCSLERMEKLKTKHGSIEAVGTGYLSRDARAEVKRIAIAAAAEQAKKDAAAKAAEQAKNPAPTTGTAPAAPAAKGTTAPATGKK